MAQETSIEFGDRLRQAVEGHPLAPPTPFGRQKWLQEKLKKEGGVSVSANAIFKWFHGTSRPREDNIRTLAKVLSVDDVWLSQGRRPLADAATVKATGVKGHGATLVLAGLVEMSEGRVTFPRGDDDSASLWVDLGDGLRGITVVTGKRQGDTVSYIVPEPVGDNLVIAVNVRTEGTGFSGSGVFELLDLTKANRKNFGGFSVVQCESRGNGKVKVEGQRNLIEPIRGLAALAG